MFGRRNFFTTGLASLFLAALLLAGTPSKSQAGEFGEDARIFIERLTQEAISTLTGKELSKAERAMRFRTLMNENFAIKGIAKFVLGRHWRKASESEQKEYLKLFEDLLVATYADRFAKYSGEKLLVEKADVRNQKDAIVHSTMISVDSSKPLKVAWRVRAKKGSLKIIDIMVEGVSMAVTQRSEFNAVVRRQGIQGLLHALRARTEKFGVAS